MSKRGISPLVASILLIVFVLIIAVLVMSWMRSGVERTMEAGGEKVDVTARCLDAGVNVADISCDTEGLCDVKLINTGIEALTGIQLTVFGDTTTEVGTVTESVNAGASTTITGIDVGTDPGTLIRAEVVPVISGGVVCEASVDVWYS